MAFLALAMDYDGTIAQDGVVDAPTIAALERLRGADRRLVLVTGREVGDLSRCLPQMALFDWIVAENGALLNRPATQETRMLAPPVPEALSARLREIGVEPLSVGQSIVATTTSNNLIVQAALDELGLTHEIILNKGSLMILPSGTNKGTGLFAALAELGVKAKEMIAVGDAENDLPFLNLCGMRVAVANALPLLKEQADLVTEGARGAGVVELIDLPVYALFSASLSWHIS